MRLNWNMFILLRAQEREENQCSDGKCGNRDLRENEMKKTLKTSVLCYQENEKHCSRYIEQVNNDGKLLALL